MSSRFLLIAFLLAFSACTDSGNEGAAPAPAPAENLIPFRAEGRLSIFRDGEPYIELAIEIVETDSTRNRGMMQRESMPDRSGMLFLFNTMEERSFWMANTPLALDLIFVDADSVVMRAAKYIQPMSPESITSNGPAQFVLELAAGYSDTIGLIEGDRLSWTRNSSDDGR